jgi:hypothetical protein
MSNKLLDTKHRLIKVDEQIVPPTPDTTYGTIYLSSITGNLSIKKDTGAIVDLEEDPISTLLTTRGDIIVRDATVPVNLPIGPVGNFLYSDGTDVSWNDSTKRLNIISKDVVIATSYTTSLQDNQILNITTSSGNDILNLPDATTLLNGWSATIVNNSASTELLNIRIFDNTVLQVLGISSSLSFALLNNSIQNGVWEVTGRSDHNIINVGESDTKFTSINAALASITDNSITNPYQIRISPGNYVETPITMKSFVSIYSNTQTGVNIIASGPTNIIITAASNCTISNVTITGATGAGGTGIYIDGVDTFSLVGSIITNCQTLVKAVATVASSPTFQVLLLNNVFNVTGTNGIWIDGTAITSNDLVKLVLKNNTYGGSTTNTAVPTILVEGPTAEVSLLSGLIVGDGTNGVGLVARDGADVHITGAEFSKLNIAIDNQNTGAPCNMLLSGITISDSVTSDVLISNTLTTGFISGVFDETISSILSTSFSALVLDADNNNISLIGELRLGYNQSGLVNVTDAIINPSLGLLSGGNLTAGTGVLEIDVSSGIGYVELTDYNASHVGRTIKRVDWADDTLTLSASSSNYIYVDNTGTVTSSLSSPSYVNTILIGIVRTDSTTRELISRDRVDALRNTNIIYQYIREILKNQYISGSIVTSNPSRQIAISSGEYYVHQTKYFPSGVGIPATFYQYNRSAGAWVFASATVVNNTQYDNLTNLTALTTSYFAKHALYIIGDAVTERYMLVIGQEEFATLNDATNGNRPNPPPWFNGIVTIIASLIIQEGVSTINTILDERPFLGGGAGTSGTAGISDHGDLSGLGGDDHTQYLLVDGTRSMGGNLGMGTNAITNVGLVDGVTVSAHASRHLPNGADPLTTAAPLANVTVISTNTTGTANSMARSDHTHALTLNKEDITPTTTKGDIMVDDGVNLLRFGVGTNDQVLTADSAEATGIKWSSPAAATSLTYTNVPATVLTSTTAATYQVITTMTVTPTSGTYIVTFNSSANLSTKNNLYEYAIFKAGVIDTVSHRNLIPVTNGPSLSITTQSVIAVNGAQTIDVRYQTDGGTFTVYERSMILIKVA